MWYVKPTCDKILCVMVRDGGKFFNKVFAVNFNLIDLIFLYVFETVAKL
jgi:hypothetical protein